MALTNGIPSEFHKKFAAYARLEPRCRSGDFARGLEARTADPLWMLARQWQTGEFQGEDAGSPLEVHIKHSTQSLDRVRLGETGEPFNLSNVPLETIVEQERVGLDWRTRVQIGQQFERFVRSEIGDDDPGLARDVIEAYRSHRTDEGEYTFLLVLPQGEEWVGIDRATRRFLHLVASRVIDGKKLLEKINFTDQNQHQIPLLGGVTEEQLNSIIGRVKEWCYALNIHPDPSKPEAWRSQQLDYRFELNPPEDTRPIKTRLIAPNYRNGELDWYTFNIADGLQGDWIARDPIKNHPTRITVGGTSPRWWAFEDANIDFGKLDVAKPDLAKLILMEFALIYGDDWFSVPLPVQMPNLVKIDELKVLNVFGEDLIVNPARKPDPDPLLRWEMFTLSPVPNLDQPGVGNPDRPGVGDVLFIPPVAGFREESPVIEEVRFLRDEGANMVWAVEHTVLNGLGRPIDGFDAQRERSERQREADISRLEAKLAEIEQQLAAGGLSDEESAKLEAEAQAIRGELARLREGPRQTSSGVPRYRLATTVPENWIPFIPTDVSAVLGRPGIRLCRAQMLRNTDDEKPSAITAISHLLELKEDPLLWLEEAAVPRSGVRVQLTAQRVRWVDGKTYVWLGRKVLTSRGEGASGLRFDVLRQLERK